MPTCINNAHAIYLIFIALIDYENNFYNGEFSRFTVLCVILIMRRATELALSSGHFQPEKQGIGSLPLSMLQLCCYPMSLIILFCSNDRVSGDSWRHIQ